MSVLEEPDLGVEGYAYCKCFISLLLSNIQLSYYAADASVNTIFLSQCCTDPSKTGQLIWQWHIVIFAQQRVQKSPTVFCYVAFKNGVHLHNMEVQNIVNKVGATSDQ